MRVKKLTLQSFRAITDSTLDIGDATFVVIRGANMSGKTSIAQGLSMALTPSTMGLNLKGDGFATKIMRGEEKAVITAEVQGGTHLIRRTVTLNTNTTGRSHKTECVDDPTWSVEKFTKLLKDNEAALLVALNTDFYITLDDEEKQKSILARLVLPAQYDFPEDKIAAVMEILGSGVVHFGGDPFTAINVAYDKLYKARTAVNVQVKDFDIPAPLQSPQGLNLAEIQTRIEVAKAERSKITEQRDAANKKVNELQLKKGKIQGRIDSLRTQIATETHAIERKEKELLSDAKLKEFQRLISLKDKYAELTESRKDVAEKLKDQRKDLDRMNALPEDQSVCDACGQRISPGYAAASRRDAKELYDQTVEVDAELLQELKAMGNVEGAIADLAKHEAALKEITEIRTVISEKEKLVHVDQAEILMLGDLGFSQDQFTEAVDKADKEIEELINQRQPVMAAEERQKEIERKTEQLKALQAKAAKLDSLVKYFDKDGVKAELIAQHIGSFEEKLNETMQGWGYKCALSIEPFFFEVTTAKGKKIPVKELCGAEREIFSVALQCAVSRAAGVRLVVVDEVSMLLPEIRPILNKLLYTAVQNKQLDQVIMLIADAGEQVGQLPYSAFFAVKDGVIRSLGRDGRTY